MDWHDSTCRRLDLAKFGDGMCCMRCGSVRPAHPILPAIRQLSEIRLLRLSPGVFDDDIVCEIMTVDLSSPLDYEAVSYTWADETGDTSHCRTIWISQKPFQVTKNCEMALKRVRMFYSYRNIWIDAVCINQDDINERGHQVGLMPQIYSRAKGVLMYIGEEHSATLALKAPLDRMQLSLPQYWADLVSRRYFTRLWVLQEVALARKATLLYSEHSLSWSAVREKVLGLNLQMVPPAFFFDFRTYTTPNQMLDMLVFAKGCNALDPRDKVFALLGLVPSGRIGDMEADYSLTVNQVYTRIAISLGSSLGCMPVLARASRQGQSESLKSSLPSWVPDWSAPPELEAHVGDFPKDFPRLDFSYQESRNSIALKLLYTPAWKAWHIWDDGALPQPFTSDNPYLWFKDESKMHYLILRMFNLTTLYCGSDFIDFVRSNNSNDNPYDSFLSDVLSLQSLPLLSQYFYLRFCVSCCPCYRDVCLSRADYQREIQYSYLLTYQYAVKEIDPSRYELLRLRSPEFNGRNRFYGKTSVRYLSVAIAVQILTLSNMDSDLVDMLNVIDDLQLQKKLRGWLMDATYEVHDEAHVEKAINALREHVDELEPAEDAELENLWMRKFLAGELIKLKNLVFNSENGNFMPMGKMRELMMRWNDTFWRLLVRSFTIHGKSIEIV